MLYVSFAIVTPLTASYSIVQKGAPPPTIPSPKDAAVTITQKANENRKLGRYLKAVEVQANETNYVRKCLYNDWKSVVKFQMEI